MLVLSDQVIQRLNEITLIVETKNKLNDSDIAQIKNMFYEILRKGKNYDVEEIESCLSEIKNWKNNNLIIRITNLAHYVQDKFEQTSKFRIIKEYNEESCECNN